MVCFEVGAMRSKNIAVETRTDVNIIKHVKALLFQSSFREGSLIPRLREKWKSYGNLIGVEKLMVEFRELPRI